MTVSVINFTRNAISFLEDSLRREIFNVKYNFEFGKRFIRNFGKRRLTSISIFQKRLNFITFKEVFFRQFRKSRGITDLKLPNKLTRILGTSLRVIFVYLSVFKAEENSKDESEDNFSARVRFQEAEECSKGESEGNFAYLSLFKRLGRVLGMDLSVIFVHLSLFKRLRDESEESSKDEFEGNFCISVTF